MNSKNWTKDEKVRLRALHIDPVRNSPERVRALIDHFQTPGASLWAVTDGDGPIHASRGLARKIRDHLAAGALDWVMERTPDRPDHEHETEWRGLLLSRPAEFSMSVDAYRDELGCQIQNTEIHLRLRAGFMAPRVAYGPSHRPFVESIFSKDPELAGLRTEFESALNNGELAEARGLSEKISLTLLDRIAI